MNQVKKFGMDSGRIQVIHPSGRKSFVAIHSQHVTRPAGVFSFIWLRVQSPQTDPSIPSCAPCNTRSSRKHTASAAPANRRATLRNIHP